MGDLSPEQEELLQRYNSGLELYRARQWDRAMDEFRLALAAQPQDGPSLLYLGRCEEYKQNPPPENWDGVFTAKCK